MALTNLIVTNTGETGVVWGGQLIEASTGYDIQDVDRLRLSSDDRFIVALETGTAVINDGDKDLSYHLALRALDNRVNTHTFLLTASGTVESGTYLRTGTTPSNRAGDLIIFDGYIGSVTISMTESATCSFDIVINDVVSQTIELSNEQRKVVNGLSVAVSRGDRLAIKVNTGPVQNPVVNVFIEG